MSESVVEKETVKKYRFFLFVRKICKNKRGDSVSWEFCKFFENPVNGQFTRRCIFHELVTLDGKENRTLGQRVNACSRTTCGTIHKGGERIVNKAINCRDQFVINLK